MWERHPPEILDSALPCSQGQALPAALGSPGREGSPEREAVREREPDKRHAAPTCKDHVFK